MNTKEAIEELKELNDALGTALTEDALITKTALEHAIEVMKASEWQPIESAPRDGSVFYGVGYAQIPYRFKLYSPYSQEYKQGIKGRWQRLDEYGGWNNTVTPPQNWIPQPPKEGG
jgi:hypothetical protein